MPVWLQIAVGVVAILGFGISLLLAWLRFEERQAKPDLQISMDWMVGGGDKATLLIVVENHGRARGGVRHVVLSPTEQHDPSTGFVFYDHYEMLPAAVDPGSFVRLAITVNPRRDTALTHQLLSGTFTHAVLIDWKNNTTAFAIPKQPDEQRNRASLVGRVSRG
jgi:hypothetical protein